MPVSTPPRPYDRIVPIIIAVALFMENMDSTVIATSLPAIAQALGTNPLALKLAVTSYLLALAICIPASGWVADRYGARKVFRIAIGVFVLGSIGCALSALAGGIRAGADHSRHGRSDDDAGRPSHPAAQHRQARSRQCHVAGDHHRPGRPDQRSAARRFHHHLRVLALDFHHQCADRPGRHCPGDALHSGRSRRAARALRLCRFRPVRARRRRARFRAVGHGAGVLAGGRGCRPDRRRRRFVGGLCRPRQAHGSADPRSDAVQIADLPRQRFRRVHVQARHWRYCRSCCRCCCSSDSA